MKKLSKQDRNGVRTPVDIERRYNFNKLDELEDTEARIVNLESNKVDKVAGKNLSSNDFTNGYKASVDDNTEARHTHSNKSILDTYTKTEEELETLISGATADSHTHDNKDLLDSYKQTETNLADAVSKKHTHSNKSILDKITQAYIDEWSKEEVISYESSDYEGHIWYANGLLEQWGRVSITPTSANTVTSATVTFPKSYDIAPEIDAVPQIGYPNAITWSVGGGATVADSKKSMIIYMTRTNTSATMFRWRAKGYKNPT